MNQRQPVKKYDKTEKETSETAPPGAAYPGDGTVPPLDDSGAAWPGNGAAHIGEAPAGPGLK